MESKAQKRQRKIAKKLPKRASHVASDHYLKYERYRRLVGRPCGPGRPGQKAGQQRGCR